MLSRIPSVEIGEPEYWKRDEGLCCGAGGAQMWMEEQNNNRVNVKRTLQLIDTGATTIASACPFCMTMLGADSKPKTAKTSASSTRRAPRRKLRSDEPIPRAAE